MFPKLLSRAGSSLQKLLPSTCWVCHRWGQQSVCDDCLSQFAKPRLRCATCAVPVFGVATSAEGPLPRCGNCLSMGSALDACHAAVDYAYPWQLLLQRFKYSDSGDLTAQPSLAHCLAYVMKEVARQDASLQAALREAQKSWLIPVPLHPDRQRERGFNQASALAHALFPGHPRLDGDLLLRVKNTAIQANLPRDSRAHNLRHAFAVPPSKVGILKGESVILIDDVATTTATISAAAAALRQVGVKEIRALVMARAV